MKSDSFSGLPHNAMLAVYIILGVVIVGFLLIYIFYLKNLQDLLKNVKPENRKVAPGKVWWLSLYFTNVLFAIPTAINADLPKPTELTLSILEYAIYAFILVWTFYLVNKIAESLAAELTSRNMPYQGKPTYAIGMFMCLCNTLSLAGGAPGLEWVALMASGAGLVAWIMYWVKTHEYKRLLATSYTQPFDF